MRARNPRSRPRRALAATLTLTAAALTVAACGWDPKRPFEREAPEVREAVAMLDGGDAQSAAATLEEYLSTGACAEGNIGTPDRVKTRPNGAFDLGLALFKIGEAFGRRFGEEEYDAGANAAAEGQETLQKLRHANVDCALRIVRAMAESEGKPIDLRARAHYLEGNLDFLDGQYEDAVKAYDKSLGLTPGQVDAGDPVGRDAAWNRAIALRRIEDKKDAGNDASKDGASDANDKSDAPQDGSSEGGQSPDGGNDDDKKKDSGTPNSPDGGGNDASPPKQPDAGSNQGEQDAAPPPPPRANQDERILDQLESAPTLQQEAAKNAASKRRVVRGMADK